MSYVYLPGQLAAPQMGLSLAALCGAVCLLLASLIATLYALILTGFTAVSRGPLSTT
jgi:hypothetical protein